MQKMCVCVRERCFVFAHGQYEHFEYIWVVSSDEGNENTGYVICLLIPGTHAAVHGRLISSKPSKRGLQGPVYMYSYFFVLHVWGSNCIKLPNSSPVYKFY